MLEFHGREVPVMLHKPFRRVKKMASGQLDSGS